MSFLILVSRFILIYLLANDFSVLDDILHQITPSGEIAQELNKQLEQFAEEERLIKEKNEKLSKELIRKILKEEKKEKLKLTSPRVTRRQSRICKEVRVVFFLTTF